MYDECDIEDQSEYSKEIRVVGATLSTIKEQDHSMDTKHSVDSNNDPPWTDEGNGIKEIKRQ